MLVFFPLYSISSCLTECGFQISKALAAYVGSSLFVSMAEIWRYQVCFVELLTAPRRNGEMLLQKKKTTTVVFQTQIFIIISVFHIRHCNFSQNILWSTVLVPHIFRSLCFCLFDCSLIPLFLSLSFESFFFFYSLFMYLHFVLAYCLFLACLLFGFFFFNSLYHPLTLVSTFLPGLPLLYNLIQQNIGVITV
jgi:hypothetical protein